MRGHVRSGPPASLRSSSTLIVSSSTSEESGSRLVGLAEFSPSSCGYFSRRNRRRYTTVAASKMDSRVAQLNVTPRTIPAIGTTLPSDCVPRRQVQTALRRPKSRTGRVLPRSCRGRAPGSAETHPRARGISDEGCCDDASRWCCGHPAEDGYRYLAARDDQIGSGARRGCRGWVVPAGTARAEVVDLL